MKRNHGFSVLEMAIALLVITILLSGVLAGRNIIEHSKNQHIVSEITAIHRAVNAFKAEYNYLPGDFPTAFELWDLRCGANAVSCNGDGNERIAMGPPSEDLLFWRHLMLAELYTGIFSGVAPTPSRYEADENAKSSRAHNNALYSFITITNEQSLYNNIRGHLLQLGVPSGTALPSGGFTHAASARSIDVKIDDGIAQEGILRVSRGTRASDNTGCLIADANDASRLIFDRDNTQESCYFQYWYQLF